MMVNYLYSNIVENNGRTVLKNVNHSIHLNDAEFKIIYINII